MEGSISYLNIDAPASVYWTLSSAGSERLPYKQEVSGSIPLASTKTYSDTSRRDPQNRGHALQIARGRFWDKAEVVGSPPDRRMS